MNEKGVTAFPQDLSFIQDTQARDSWWRWFTQIWSAVPKVQTFNQTITAAAVGANSESVQTFTVTGLTTLDTVIVNKPTNQSGLDLVHAWVSAANTLSIKYRNHTGGGITPTAETYLITAVRR